MTQSQTKAFTWRVSHIPINTTEEELCSYFTQDDGTTIEICSLCPDVDVEDGLVATILFRPHSEHPFDGPKLQRGAPNIEIERDFEGFTPLYCPPAGEPIAVDIIAVTGLAGHAFGSWAHSESKMWLRDYVPNFARTSRVLTYGYNSQLVGEHTSATILGDLTKSFITNLIDMRNEAEAMTAARQHLGSSRLPVRAIIFLAAPHRGMNVDALRTLVKNEPPQKLVDELAIGSPTLDDLNDRFMDIAQDIDILTCFETRKTKTVKYDELRNEWTRSGPEIMMLEPHSAKQYWPKETIVHAIADHSGIAKVKRGQGSILQPVKGIIRRAMTPTADIARERQWNEDGHRTIADADIHGQQAPRQEQQHSQRTDTDRPIHTNILPVNDDTLCKNESPQVEDPEKSEPLDQPFLSDIPLRSKSSLLNRSFSRNPSGESKLLCDGCDTEIGGAFYQCAECPDGDYCLECLDSSNILHPNHKFIPANAGEIVASRSPGSISSSSEYNIQSSWIGECIGCDQPILPKDVFYGCSICSLDNIVCEAGRLSVQPCPKHPDVLMMKHRLIWYGKRPYSVVWVSPEPQEEDSLIVKALKKGNVDLLRQLTQDPRLVNGINSVGQTALHVAASLDLQAGARLLLMNGAKLEARDGSGYTALGQAVLAKKNKVARMMLERGASVNSMELGGSTLLHLACITGSIEMVDVLLEKGIFVDRPDGAGQTAFMLSCQLDELSVARHLLDQGANPNGLHAGEETLLGNLAGNNKSQAVRLLLENCAEVERRDNLGRTALFRAATGGQSEVCRILIAHGANPNTTTRDRDQTALGEAAASGSEDTVRVLLEKGAYVEGTDSLMRTPLFRAAELGEFKMCRLLLEKGADPNPQSACSITSDWAMTILHAACWNGYANVAEVLIQYGAKLEAPDQFGRTALFLAAEYGLLEICQSLIEESADLEATAYGHSILSIAARYGHLDVVANLIAEGASAMPPSSVQGRKWKNFLFENNVEPDVRSKILELLRAYKHL